jgi:predicted alpha/beta superfamily hydrolase
MWLSLRTLMLITAVLFWSMLPALGQQTPPAYPNVPILGSELRALKSSNTGRNYDIYIKVPGDYGSSKDKKYPVLYVMDGQWDFKLLDSVYGGLFYDKFVPAMIIVAVTYSGASPDYGSLRAMDYTPTSVSQVPGSGGAPKFLTFLKSELVPFIETNYRADASNRVLLGSSYGGLFTLYAMFAEPGLFSGFIAASPAVPYDDRFSFKQESEYFAKHKDLPARLYIAVGEQEFLAAPVKEFMQVLTGRNYKGLQMQARVIQGERHASNKPEVYNRGLRYVFGQQQ